MRSDRKAILTFFEKSQLNKITIGNDLSGKSIGYATLRHCWLTDIWVKIKVCRVSGR